MKKDIAKMFILSLPLVFIGCSTKTPEANKKPLSVYNIMGIEEPQEMSVHYVHSRYHNNNTSHHANQAYMPIVSDNVEVVAYGSYNPVKQSYLNSSQIKDRVEWSAKSFLGKKYVWGATGPNAFDCSGLTQWVYRDVGINIPRVSRDQARVGQYVSYHQLRRGDMVFFDTKKKKNGIVSHVGIYLGGCNFIHASSGAKKVVIYNFEDKPFYKKRFMWGRRVIHDNMHLASN